MRKFFWWICCLLSVCAFTGCGGQKGTSDDVSESGGSVPPAGKVLVAYFSRSGNTETVACLVAERTKGDVAEIIPATPYPQEYADVLFLAQQERQEDARPAISEETTGRIKMEKYNTVFIGYPIWHGGEPMIIRTFFEAYPELSDKIVYLFSTSGSSGGGAAVESLEKRYTQIKNSLHLTNSALGNASAAVKTWIDELDILGQDIRESVEGVRVKMRVTNENIFVVLVDNSASRDLADRLKKETMTLSFADFGGSEKIAYPSPPLDVSDVSGCDPVEGDLTIYIPWGNLAVFYRDTSGYSSALVHIGRIEGKGIEILAAQKGEFSVVLELTDS